MGLKIKIRDITLMLAILSGLGAGAFAQGFCDNFEDSSWQTRWVVINGIWDVENGEYSCYSSASSWAWSRAQVIAQNGEITLDAKPQPGSITPEITIDFREQADWTKYEWINFGWNNNYSAFLKWIDGNATFLGFRAESGMNGTNYYCQLVMDGANFKCYRNGELIFDITDGEISSGGTFTLHSYDSHIHFDNVCYTPSSSQPSARISIAPNPIYIYWAFALDPKPMEVVIGDLSGGYSVGDIDPSTILLNDGLQPEGYEIISGYPGFSGEVMAAHFSISDFVDSYPLLYDTTIQVYSISLNLNNGPIINQEDSLTIIGRKSRSVGKEFIIPEAELHLPNSYELTQNFPNPFNPLTEISFSLPRASDVTFEIYNITGQKVATLVNGALEAGEHTVQWDSRDESGNAVASGIYFYRLTAGEFTDTKKMILLK